MERGAGREDESDEEETREGEARGGEGGEGVGDSDEEVYDVEGDAQPQRKRKVPAPVWEHGGQKIEGGSKCLLCGKEYKSDINNTTNLVKHILTKHKKSEEAKELAKAKEAKKQKTEGEKKEKEKKERETKKFKQGRIDTFVKKAAPIDPLKKKDIERKIVEYLTVENKSFDTVEKESFRKLLFSAEPAFICPSRRTITNQFDRVAESIKASLKDEICKDLSETDVKAVHITRHKSCRK